MKNKNLAIAIPTYNRAEILNENILAMLNEIEQFSIPVYISDDSTNEATESIVADLKKQYEFIYYHKNSPGLGHDLNCIRTLSLPSEEYIWYLGDSYIIKPGGLGKVLDVVLSKDFDFISVNVDVRKGINDRIFENGNELLINLGWHLILTSATIYSKRALKLLNRLDLKKCKNFPQTAIIFEQFAMGAHKLCWLDQQILYCNSRKQSYWKKDVFNVFLNDLDSFVSNLPPFYTERNKQIAIKMHADKTGIFSWYSFLSYRSKGIFDFRVLKSFYKLIRNSCNVSPVLLFIIALIPKIFLRFFSWIVDLSRKYLKLK